jgi:hypothetical protein
VLERKRRLGRLAAAGPRACARALGALTQRREPLTGPLTQRREPLTGQLLARDNSSSAAAWPRSLDATQHDVA